jgi:integrase
LGWIQTPQPRLHDFRHTFTVRCLIGWYRSGENVGPKMLALSAYLGHRHVTSTYWYLTAVPELMALANARWETSAEALTGGAHA